MSSVRFTRLAALACVLVLPVPLVNACGGTDPLPSGTVESTPTTGSSTVASETTTDAAGIPVILIYDASSSMLTDDAGGATRLDAAEQASLALLDVLEDDTPLSLITFGDTVPDSVGDASAEGLAKACSDVTTHFPLGTGQRDEARDVIVNVGARGYTPLKLALEQAERQLPSTGEATIVLLSDGEDTCGAGDPVEIARGIRAEHPEVTVNTVGLKTSNRQLIDIAGAGGGTFVTADNIAQLVARLSAARSATTLRERLSDSGVYGIGLGTAITDIRAEYADFPPLSEGSPDGDLVVIVWRNCRWYFNGEGALIAIALIGDSVTVDGLGAGSPLRRATELFGDPVARERVRGDLWRVWYPASGGLYWKITFTGDGGGTTGTITVIELCACTPPVEAPPARETMVVSFDGYGPLKLGMSASTLDGPGVSRTKAVPDYSGAGKCHRWEGVLPESPDVGFIAREGEIITVPVVSTRRPLPGEWATDRGVAIGDTAGELRAAYPDLQGWQEPNFINGPGQYNVWSTDSRGRSIVFQLSVDGQTEARPMPDNAVIFNLFVTSAPATDPVGFRGEALHMRGCD
ncbi:VWA domain-containing protein [Corynebacterium sp. P6129]|uniref:vWA domain-containing protein n=1 Tax=Corynebacterium antarcticum TaxID=2800405 RepID=UPI002260C2FF|nr:VWA domain-containing protein [Corynebacterium antarcticum]MCX7492856.1 VWA domain-containing protein [Corynebacterium antarcticum]